MIQRIYVKANDEDLWNFQTGLGDLTSATARAYVATEDGANPLTSPDYLACSNLAADGTVTVDLSDLQAVAVTAPTPYSIEIEAVIGSRRLTSPGRDEDGVEVVVSPDKGDQ